MPQLIIQSVPGSTDTHDDIIVTPNYVTDDIMVAMAQNSKFAAIRTETIFAGYYKSGDVIGVPISPVDGYEYDRREVRYFYTLTSLRGPGQNFISGQKTCPSFGDGTLSLHQPTNIYLVVHSIDDVTGQVSILISYFSQGKVSETITNDGLVKVYVIGQRQSVNF